MDEIVHEEPEKSGGPSKLDPVSVVQLGELAGDEALMGVRHRRHRFPGRSRAVKVLYDETEFAGVQTAALAVGLTPTGFVAAALTLADPNAGGRLAGLLNAPLALVELAKDATPVYHLAISAAKDPDTGAPRERLLTDAEWTDVAAEYLDRIGLAPRGDADGVRWVAVRHALDHIHVVATLARQDGKRVWPYRDFRRSREASHGVEARYGLISTAPADRTGTPETTRAEHRRLADVNAERAEGGLPAQPAPDRDVLRRQVRTALAGSDNLEQFLDLLRI